MSATKAELVRALNDYARPSNAIGFSLFAADVGQAIAGLLGVLFLAPLWAKIACGIFVGIKLGNLLVLAHDAAHGCLVKGEGFNKILAVISLGMCLHNYRLWILDHHGLHHPNTNGGHKGTYTPYSLDNFRRLPVARQWLERFYRSGNPLALGVHYAKERWLDSLFLPRRARIEREADWHSASRHGILVLTYLVAWLGLLVAAPLFSETSATTAVLVGFAVPYMVFSTLVGFVEFAQHTHPNVGWFRRESDKPMFVESELVSVHLRTPKWFGFLIHNVLDHPAHHVHAKVPVYRLRDAQEALNRILGTRAVIDDLSLGWYLRTMRTCKVFDFGNQRWLDFAGNVSHVVASRRSGDNSPAPRRTFSLAERPIPQ